MMSALDAETMRAALEKLNHKKLLRILAPLVHRRAFLSQVGDNGESGYRYLYRGQRMSSEQGVIAPEDVRLLLAEDLVEPCPQGLRISEAGRARLKRELSAADPFQSQHGARRPELRSGGDGGPIRLVMVNDAESPLAWLASRKDRSGAALISKQQFAAGERLRADYTYAAMTPRMTARYDATPSAPLGGSEVGHLSDTVLAARDRVSRALEAVGPELSGVLIDVCCHLKGLEDTERREGWPKRSGKVVLQMALSALSRHYGLIGDPAQTGSAHRRLQHWGATDYRPSRDGGDVQAPAAC